MARNIPSSADSVSSKGVNDLLHNLRGEQFRHTQNTSRSRAHITSAYGHNTPTLPTGLLGLAFSDEDYEIHPQSLSLPTKYSGPAPPKSWSHPTPDIHQTAAWRTQALSIIFSHRPSALQYAYIVQSDESKTLTDESVPPLVLLCLKRLLTGFTTSEFTEDIVPCLPPHLRLELIRYTSIHSPLPNNKLRALLEPHGHADSELLIVGPFAAIQDNYLPRPSGQDSSPNPAIRNVVADWDTEDWSPQPLQSFILLSTHLATSSLLTLPPTITHMALINVAAPVPLYRLPAICPLLLVLDLSYNIWLAHMSHETMKIVERINWSRWARLRTLGWRACDIPSGMLDELNRGRWDDVEVVL